MVVCPPCPLCNEAECREADRCKGYRLYRCTGCELVFADPMTPGDEFYYRQFSYQAPDPETVRTHCHLARSDKNRRLLTLVSQGGKVLDVGCGFGAFVRFAVDLGLDAYGFDFNRDSIEIGRSSLGLEQRIVTGDIGNLQTLFETKGLFDLVTLFEVIEHVPDPTALIRNVRKRLKPSGLLALSCPNEDRWSPGGRIFVDYPPHHLTRWRPVTLRTFLEKEGFEYVGLEVDCSFADVILTAYGNWSAKRGLEAMHAETRRNTTQEPSQYRRGLSRRQIKSALLDIVKAMCSPIDVPLKLLGVGTMCMRMVVRKSAQ